jgi:arginine exporter protein ArgO
MPAGFAIGAPPAFLVALGIEREDLLGVFLTMTLFGLSYLAWCLVGVRFALAVGRRDRAAADVSTSAESAASAL